MVVRTPLHRASELKIGYARVSIDATTSPPSATGFEALGVDAERIYIDRGPLSGLA